MDNIYNSIQTNIEEVPQLQTVVREGDYPITTIIDAPFIEVTSVNGMTGDVIIDPIIREFEPNHYYAQGSAIVENGKLYYAKASFTSGNTFNVSDWDAPDFAQEQADWNESDNTKNSYIKNKPSLATVATSGSYADLTNIPANLVQDANYVHTDENYTSDEKTKLSGIATGAQVNVIEAIEANGTTLTPDANKKVSFNTMTMTVSTTDIGEGATLASDTLYVVVGS